MAWEAHPWKVAAVLTALLLAAVAALSAPKDAGTPPEAPDPAENPLSLSPDRVVKPGSGLVTVVAKIASKAVKTRIVWGAHGSLVDPDAEVQLVPEGDHAHVGIPACEGEITVFAVAVLDGEPTPFAASKITIRNGKAAGGVGQGRGEGVPPAGGPAPVRGAAHVSVIIADTSKLTPAQALVVNSQRVQAALQAAGIKPHGFSLATARDVEALRSRKLLAPVQAVGTPCLVIQDASGRVLPAGRALPLPASEEDFLALLGLK